MEVFIAKDLLKFMLIEQSHKYENGMHLYKNKFSEIPKDKVLENGEKLFRKEFGDCFMVYMYDENNDLLLIPIPF